MGYRTIAYHIKLPLAYLSLSRPRASNRVNPDMAMELRQVCQALREENGVRVVIVTGKGRAFSCGRDAPGATESGGSYGPAEWLGLHRAASSLAAVEIPVIAAINGDATDHGLELALACDLRIAAKGARLGLTDVSLGRIPWDGGTQRLPRLVGRARALEMILQSRLVDSQEALAMGLVNQVVEPSELMVRTEEVALVIASGAPIAARYAKETVLKGLDMTIDQGLRLEADLSVLLQSTRDRAEGLRSFLEKRQPEFRGE